MSVIAARLRGPWSLQAKLIAAVVALFLAVTAATGVFTVLSLQRSLTEQLDRDLASFTQRVDRGGDADHDGRPGDGGPPPMSNRVLRLELAGGTVLVNNVVSTSNENAQLTPAQISQLRSAQLGPRPKTVNLGSTIGEYRLVSDYTPRGTVAITGFPISGASETVSQLVVLLVTGTGLGLLVVAAGGIFLVRRSLEPLDRVAATASRVSRLELDSGDVALAERVPAPYTDPRTEVGQVGLALNSMLDNVEGALRARQDSEMRVRQFVADASHELRTPLASIRGYAELSRREREPVPPSVTHALGRVESETMRMSTLVDDLLLLARLDAGRPLDRNPVDLSLLAVDVVGDAHAAAPSHQWRLDLPDEPVEVKGDSDRLHQVVANLLANARSHTPSGTTVTTSVKRVGDWVRIAVHDNGPGVPTTLQPNVFQRFTRGDDSRSRQAGSTGLGLSIVDAVTQAHGGRVELKSRPGDTTFSVLLPSR